MKTKLASLLSVLAVVAAVSACNGGSTGSGPPESQLIQARDKLAADLRQCTATHNYDPDNVAALAENALAPRELEWRQCAYSAVRVYERSNPSLTGMYEQLIAQDMSMTAAIQQGTMTRSQRRDRIEKLVTQIKAAEQDEVTAATTEQARQNAQVRMVVQGVRGFR